MSCIFRNKNLTIIIRTIKILFITVLLGIFFLIFFNHSKNNIIHPEFFDYAVFPDTLLGENYPSEYSLFIGSGLDYNGGVNGDPESLIKLINGQLKLHDNKRDDHVEWTNIGPFDSKNTSYQNQGRIDAISVHPYYKQNILVGSANGGIWKSKDGGNNWYNTTDDEGFSVCGMSAIVRHPANPDIVYASTSAYLGLWNSGRSYGVGIIRSDDGGETWTYTGLQRPLGEWNSAMEHIVIDPSSTLNKTILYAINTTSLFRYSGPYNASGKWETVYRDGEYFSGPYHYGNVKNHDLEIMQDGTVWFSNIKGVFLYSNNKIKKIENIPVPKKHDKDIEKENCNYNNPVKAFYDIEINKLNEIVLLINYYRFEKIGKRCVLKNKPFCITRSTDNGQSWSSPVSISTSGFAYPQMCVSPYNANVLYLEGGNRKMYKSINGGRTLKMMKQDRNHVDVRCLLMHGGTAGDTTGQHDVLFVGTDGGISISDNGKSWRDITGYGICNTNYFGVAITESDPGYLLAGAQDGSINLLDGNQWYTTPPGGDNGDCLIDPRDKTKVYQTANASLCTHYLNARRIKNQSCVKIGDTGNRHELFPLIFNPLNPDVIYTGSRSLKITDNRCKKIVSISDESVHTPKKISSIAISKDDTSVVYYSLLNFYWNKKREPSHPDNQGGIFRAKRVGDGWEISDISSNLRNKCLQDKGCGIPQAITDIAVDPKNHKRIWITMGGFESGHKVFYTRNGGKKWKNISDGLPNLPATSIVFQGDRKKHLYVGTDFGVFFRRRGMKKWAYYGNNGPRCMVSDMEINHSAGKLVVSTLGRGLWETNILN